MTAKVEVEKNFYVPLTYPAELRKDLLGDVKKILILLKRYEKFRQLRQEKINYFHKLRGVIKKLETLNNRLSKAFPKTHLRALPKTNIKKTESTKYREQKMPKPEEKKPEQMSTLHKIEKEIADIESKLQSIE